MGKTTLLLKLDENGIRDIFSKFRNDCQDFYATYYDPEYADMNAIEIRGRLDFLNEIQVDETDRIMTAYKGRIDSGETEAMYLEYIDSLAAHGKLSDALIQVAMYGQFTGVNQDLFNRLRIKALESYSPPSLKMIYESYSSLMRGSVNAPIFQPSLLIESGPKGIITILNPNAPKLKDLNLDGKINPLQPKANSEEYFAFGKHPKLK